MGVDDQALEERNLSMCKCRHTIKELSEAINAKRVKDGRDPMPYQTILNHYRKIMPFLPPDEVVGNNYIFRKGKMNKIVSALWNKSYRSCPRLPWYYRVA